MKILLSGCSGAMGRVISQVCKESEDYDVVAGYARKQVDDLGYPVYNDLSLVKEEVDVLIDFSGPGALDSIINFALERSLPLIIASTGLEDEDFEKIWDASSKIPILQSGNMSLGINILLDQVAKLSAFLEDFDVEIIEKHHNLKTDAPSGTAKMLLNSVKAGRGEIEGVVYGRQGNEATRKKGQVGVHAIRGGTIVGEHSVIFAGLDELVEIKHIASSKKIFANGALKAADFIINKDKGLFTMKDVI